MQWCSREYHETLVAAGLQPHVVTFEIDRSLRARFLRRFRPRPYAHRIPSGLGIEIATWAQQHGARWCFLNNTDALPLAPVLRAIIPSLRLVFLSHGAEITDVVNNLRLAPGLALAHQCPPTWIGRLIYAELDQRSALDATIVISRHDAEVERWLGAKNILFLPRQIPANELPLIAPLPGRIGCVATLDHGPNIQGLELFASALMQFPGLQLRVVGGPETAGRTLDARFPSLHYCGRLPDPALHIEAASWCAFVNPIFCPARGASTKVATALGWGLPVLTTPDGARGYIWSEKDLPLPTSPHALAALAADVSILHNQARWRQAAQNIRRLAPNLSYAAHLLRAFLGASP